MERFLQQLAFNPDAFQIEAMAIISRGDSVVVCSPTGSGKTLVAEYAAFKAVEEGRKIFYTTPLKALSNQKFHDFQEQYGEDKVGLLTGDIAINRDAQIVVMTTEVFRNMLYGIQEDSKLLNQVSCVVLDECHYMNDAQRGTVWEESIIYCPDSIQVIALSATIANALELTDWINEVHHNTELVTSDFRPVPLRFFYDTREAIVPLFKGETKQLNPKLKFDTKKTRFAKHQRAFDANRLIQELHEKDMLPAIFFTFSRKGCDKNLFETRKLSLLTDAERREIKAIVEAYVKAHPFLENNRYLPALHNGFASHHAGLLPGIKELVEKLFQKGLIKVVFATETLAAGINMPARTTVITAISKRADEGHRILTASEFLQMSGRAGRRGMDEVGYVVTVSSPYEGAYDVALLASSLADPLNSRFTPTYGMVLNILQRHTIEEAEFLISKSFGAFTAERRLQPLHDEIAWVMQSLEEAMGFQCPFGVEDLDFHRFLRERELLKETQKLLKVYKNQIKRFGHSPDLQKELAKSEGKKNSLLASTHGSPCYSCDEIRRHTVLEDQVQRLQKRLKNLNRQLEQESNWYWQQFLKHYHLLQEIGFIGVDNRPTPPGELTAGIRAENELYIAQLILSGTLKGLTPSALAAVACSVVNDSTRDNIFSRVPLSEEARACLQEVHGIKKQLYRLQNKYHLQTEMTINPIASGLVEAWAQGFAWQQLIQSTNMDEGDLVRVIRRAADLLRQLSRNDQVDSVLSDTARVALKALNRDPVKEEDLSLPQAEEEEETQEPEDKE